MGTHPARRSTKKTVYQRSHTRAQYTQYTATSNESVQRNQFANAVNSLIVFPRKPSVIVFPSKDAVVHRKKSSLLYLQQEQHTTDAAGPLTV